MTNPSSNRSEPKPEETCRVLVLYEDAASREYAAKSSRELSLAGRSGGTLEAQWFSMSALSDETASGKLTQMANGADLIVFAGSPTGDWPTGIKVWMESWISSRREREGAIVGIVMPEPSAGRVEIAGLKEIYLRHAAHRAGMDYLCRVPTVLSKAIPDSPESYSARAGQVTSLLDEILRAATQESHLRR